MLHNSFEISPKSNLPNINQVGLVGANLNRNQLGFATVLKIHSKGDKAGHWLTDLDVSFRQDKVNDHKSDLNFRADHNEDDPSFLDFGENKWENKNVVFVLFLQCKLNVN